MALSTAGLLSVSSPTFAAEEEEVETIAVTGVRSALENALNTKREAPSIVDAISATDIDALPALDLGEALQALPGVQLNSSSEGRQSTISLRGLSSGFVKTTAFGQTFATPTMASNVAVGSPNPFSAFEAGVFDGVTVVKSPTADMQEGGMAGTVDKKLQRALAKQDGAASITIGDRYEELADSHNLNVKLSASKHLIEDTLAVAFKFSYSGQEFRRDTFDVVNYVSVEADDNGDRATNLDAYRAKWSDLGVLPEDAQLRVPLRGRNVHQYSDGDRKSLSGNIEYRATDNLKLGAHVLLSERILDDGTKETTNYEAGLHRTNSANDFYMGEVTLDMDTAPFAYTPLTDDGTGGEAFIVSNIDFNNGKLQWENRKTTFIAKSQGIILYGDYAKEDWVLDSKVTHSKAENEFTNIGINFIHQGNKNTTQTPSGFNGRIDTGGGDPGQIVVSGGLEVPYVYDNLDWPTPNVTQAGVSVLAPENQGRRLSTNINGRARDLYTDYNSAEFNAKRYTEFGFGDGLRFDSVKFGVRYSQEKTESIDQVHGMPGIDMSNVGSSYISSDEVLSAHQAPFFNGKIPGTFDHTNGWVTINNDKAIEALQTNIVTDRNDLLLRDGIDEVYPELTRNRTGFWDKMLVNTGLPQLIAYNFDAQQDITAVYATTDFSGELPLDISYMGNFGVRHVKTDNTFDGFKLGQNDAGDPFAEPTRFTDDYSNTLPMANVSFELTDDVVLRAAYYDSIVRPNIVAQRPTANLQATNQRVTLDLPTATVKPYEANNYDLSLEWYNREGSAISVGFFQKNISNLFDQQEGYCPEDGSDPTVNDLIGDIERVAISDVEFGCQEVAVYQVTDPETGEVTEELNREVLIDIPINTNQELKVEGYEVAIQQKLDFLPYPWNGFGGVFNYTKIKQTGDEAKLQSVSPESYNLITYWENDGISLRFAYNWRDNQIKQGVNAFLGTGVRTQKDRGRLDFSGQYKLNEHVNLYFQAFNLTDEIGKQYYGYDERAIHTLTYSGRQYKASVSYKF